MSISDETAHEDLSSVKPEDFRQPDVQDDGEEVEDA